MLELLIKAEEEIGDIIAILEQNLAKEGFKINQIFFNPYGRRMDSNTPGYGYYLPGIRVVVQRQYFGINRLNKLHGGSTQA